ncbi:Aste57867_9014 [Aphanomyces stellatus]|uniref:Aste57867_9014 protein n=1 Tax=Aphanomyces stellatus TaxID=120398 RepID=A0A485KLW9_9STRA|nr:hypothetical protein As57867_008978 [Aphanomyces stellatus]VFT85898.1 Aste57867_9014 [Aphanomyces stellatus]
MDAIMPSSSCPAKLRLDFLMSPPLHRRRADTAHRKSRLAPKDKSLKRSGGWTVSELEYTFRLSADFKDGLLSDAAPGILLRQYLSTKLNCSPMRLSKKFDKTSGILGTHRYDPTASVLAGLTPEMRRTRKRELKQLEEAFRKSNDDSATPSSSPPTDDVICRSVKRRRVKPGSVVGAAQRGRLDLLLACLP